MARLPSISKYCVVCRVGALALALSQVYAMLTPSMGSCLMPSIVSGAGDAGRFEDGRHDVDDMVELAAHAARIVDVARPRDGHALGGPAEMRRHLLHPLERRVERPGPRRREVRVGPVGPPELVPEELILTGTSTPLKVVNSFGVPLSMPSALAPLSPLM